MAWFFEQDNELPGSLKTGVIFTDKVSNHFLGKTPYRRVIN